MDLHISSPANGKSESATELKTCNTFELQVHELRAAQANGLHVLQVRWFTSIKDIKDMLHKKLCIAPRSQDLFYGTSKLSNSVTLHDLGIEESGRILRLATKSSSWGHCHTSVENKGYLLSPSSSPGGPTPDDACVALIDDVVQGFKRGNKPIGTDALDCTGGVYFLTDGDTRKCAVFKPFDEEQGMHNNNKGYEGTGEVGLRPNFKPGQGCIREMAAYILDHDHFAGVPETVLVHCEHNAFSYPTDDRGKQSAPFPKLGSLQRFVYFQHTFDDIGTSCFSDFEVQKIALLDMRLLNCDRNASNILVLDKDANFLSGGTREHKYGRRYDRSSSICSSEDNWRGSEFFDFSEEEKDMFNSASQSDSDPDKPRSRRNTYDMTHRSSKSHEQYILVPIDHGYTLPTSLHINEYDWVWFNMRQLRRPIDQELKDYMLGLNFDELVLKLTSQVAVSEQSLFLLRLVHNLIVNGINAGLTLYDIAKLIARIDEDKPSPLEQAVSVAEENAHRAIEMRSGRLDSRSIPFPATINPRSKVNSFINTLSPMNSTLSPASEPRLGSFSRTIDTHDTDTPPLPSRSLMSEPKTDSCIRKGDKTLLSLGTMSEHILKSGPKRVSSGSNIFAMSGAESGETSSGTDSSNGLSSAGSSQLENTEEIAIGKHQASSENISGGSRDSSDFSVSSNPNSPQHSPPMATWGSETMGFLANPLNGKSLQSLKSVDSIRVQTMGLEAWRTLIPIGSSNSSKTPEIHRFSRSIKTEGDVPESKESSSLSPGKGLFPKRVQSEELDTLLRKSKVSNETAMPSLRPQLGSSGRQIRRKTSKSSDSMDRPYSPSRYDADAEVESPDDSTAKSNYEIDDSTDSSEEDDGPETCDRDDPAADERALVTAEKSFSTNLMRVTSFSSFASEPIYELESTERRFMKLNREKRKLNSFKPEFQELRNKFAEQRLGVLLARAPR